MPLSIKCLIAWAIVFAGLVSISLAMYFDTGPIPDSITRIEIPKHKILIEKKLDGIWVNRTADINATQQVLINHWVEDLQSGCLDRNMHSNDIKQDSDKKDALNFAINDLIYRFGTLNTYAGRHYLYQDDRVYLCDATLKPRLEHAYHLWMSAHA